MMNGIHTKIFIFFIVVCILITTGCVSQNKIQNTSGISANVTYSTSVQTPCPPISANATPYIIINPISSHNVGDVFEVTGTTNLGVDTKIFLDLSEPYLLDPGPFVTADPNYKCSGTKGYVKIQNGAYGTNIWSYPVNLSGYHNPKYYTVNVWEESNQSILNWTQFFINLDRSERLYPVSPPMQEYIMLYKVTAVQKDGSQADIIENDLRCTIKVTFLNFILKIKDTKS